MFIGYRLIDVNGGFFKGVIKRVVPLMIKD
jgi:hypothetical protein